MLQTLLIAVLSLGTLAWDVKQIDATEIFSWFPEGLYVSITHWDVETTLQAEAYEIYTRLFHRSQVERFCDFLPQFFREDLLSITKAEKVRLRFLNSSEYEEASSALRDPNHRMSGSIEFYFVNGRKVFAEHVGDQLFVLRFLALRPLIDTALREGILADSGSKYRERPIYFFLSNSEPEVRTELYAYATETDELLLADELPNLQLMIDAGYGIELNILEGEDFHELIGIIPDLGQHWDFINYRDRSKVFLEWLRNSSDASAEEIELYEEIIAREMQFFIWSTEIGDEIVRHRYECYLDDETAEENLRTMREDHNVVVGPGPPAEFIRLRELMAGSREWTRDDNMLVSTIVFNQDLIDAQLAAIEALERRQEEYEQQQQEQEQEQR